MPTKFETLVPDHEPLLELEPEELAGFILECLNTLPEGHGELNSHNFCLQVDGSNYPRQLHKDIKEALMEAWTWLEREGLIAPRGLAPLKVNGFLSPDGGKHYSKLLTLSDTTNQIFYLNNFSTPSSLRKFGICSLGAITTRLSFKP